MKRRYERFGLISLFALSVSVAGTLAVCAALTSLGRAGSVTYGQVNGGRDTGTHTTNSRRGRRRGTPPTPPPPPPPPPTLSPFDFETVTVDSSGSVVATRPGQSRIYSETIGDVSLEMTEVPGGKFLRGSPDTEVGHDNNEAPRKQVTVKTFYIGTSEVTQAQWKAVATKLPRVRRTLQSDPSKFKGENRPVENVSWEEAVEFCDRLSRATRRKYHLPSEAEWEYACRAKTATPSEKTMPFGFGETITPDLVNFNGRRSGTANSSPADYRATTTEVRSFLRPNGFGLFDMHGNVWEWCQDDFHESYSNAPTNGSAYTKRPRSNLRVTRGGSFKSDMTRCRSAYRGSELPGTHSNDLGFRVALSAQ